MSVTKISSSESRSSVLVSMCTWYLSFLYEIFLTTLLVCKEICRALFECVWSKKLKSLRNEVVLVTGGGKGLGRLLAIALAKHKAKHVILWGRTENPLKATASAIRKYEVDCTYMICDIGDRNQVCSSAEEVRSTIGNVTILINNAGVVYGDNVIDSSPENIERTINTNTLGQIWCIKEFLPGMKEANYGHIVCINSMLGLMGLNGAADYSASKFALTGFMESLDMELAATPNNKITTTSVHPYLVDTDMFAGCTTRFPMLFPALEKEYVVNRTITAIQRNESSVLMPRIMHFFTLFRQIMPRPLLLIVQKFAGVDKAMENFHGRKQASHHELAVKKAH